MQRSGKLDQIIKAKQIARGGSRNVPTQALQAVGMVLGAPMRAVVGAVEEVGEELGAFKEDKRNLWQNFMDVDYGAGRLVEKVAPDANPWIKRGLGFIGDVALDPLTYLTFGASPALKAAGRTPGIIRILEEGTLQAVKAGDTGLARELGNLAAKAGAGGGARLSTEELARVAKLAGREGEFAYGMHFQLPFTARGAPLATGKYNPAAAYGRSIERAGSSLTKKAQAGRLGDLLGGELASAKRALRSGDPRLTAYGSRIMDAWNMGSARASGVGKDIDQLTGQLEQRARAAGINENDALEILGQRPVKGRAAERLAEPQPLPPPEVPKGPVAGATAPVVSTAEPQPNVGGPLWQEFMDTATPEQVSVIEDYGKWLDSLPEDLADVTAVGGARTNWLNDATEAGRAYVPHSLSDEAVTAMREKHGFRAGQPRTGKAKKVTERAWFEKKAHAVGDVIGEGSEFERELAPAGRVTQHYPEGAPSLAQQMRDVYSGQMGEDYVDLFDKSLFRTVRKYREGIRDQVHNYTTQNFLRDKGISNELITWKVNAKGQRLKPGAKGGLTISAYTGKLNRDLDKLDGRMQKQLAKLDELNAQRVEATKLADETLYRRISDDIIRVENDIQSHVRQQADLQGQLDTAATEQTARQARWEEAGREVDEAKVTADAARAEMDQFAATFADQPEHWDQLRAIQQRVSDAEDRHRELMLAAGNRDRVMEEVTNNLAVIKEIDKLVKAGGTLPDDHPFMDMIEDVADRMDMSVDDVDLKDVQAMLKGEADRQLEELAGYSAAFPSVADPQEWQRLANNANKRATYWTKKMADAPDEATWQAARTMYEDAAKVMAINREMLARHRSNVGPIASEFPEWDTIKGELDNALAARQAAVDAGTTDHELDMAHLANRAEAWLQEKPEYFLNPGNGAGWMHGYSTTPVDAAQSFPLAMRMGEDMPWLDHLFGPSTASAEDFAGRYWTATDVQEIMLRAGDDRVLVYGPNQPTLADLRANVELPGDVTPGGVTDQYRRTHYSSPATSEAGPGYDFFVNDAVRRLFDENPGWIDQFLERMDSLASRDPYFKKVSKVYALARDIQSYARGHGQTVNFDEALEVAGNHHAVAGLAKWAPSMGETEFDFNRLFDLDSPLPMPGAYLPKAAEFARYSIENALDQDWLMQAGRAIRESIARDGDVILFVNRELQDAYDVTTLQALPTEQWVMEFPRQPPTGVARTVEEGVEDARVAYTGKLVDPDKYEELNVLRGVADDASRVAMNVFDMTWHDLQDTVRQVQHIETLMAGAKGQETHFRTIMDNQRKLLAEASEAFQLRAKTTMEPEARIAHLFGQAKKLEAQLEGNYDRWGQLLSERNRMEQYLGSVLHEGWEGFGFARQAPSEVVEIMGDIAKTHNSMTGEGLGGFLRGFDRVNSWMKGWLTSSIGFQTRNVFGGMFNNWLAGVDLSHAPMEWGRIYFATRPAVMKDPAKAALVSPSDQFVERVMNRAGVTGSGIFQSELGPVGGGFTGADRGWGVNPFGGIRKGSKPFIMPYTTRKVGEQVTEPWLRGTLAYDRLSKAIKQGRFKDIGLESLDDVTPDNFQALADQVSDSVVMSEMLDDVAKYHFNYEDLSSFERQVGRRLIPFYTWTRKNVPLQVEALFTQPGKAYNRYMAVKRNMEYGTEDEDIVPSYFAEQGMIHLPFQIGGNDLYGTVELPFKDPFKVADVTGQLQGMLNPLIKAPIEYMAGRQLFSDVPLTDEYKELPATWLPLLPVLRIGAELPFVPWDPPVKSESGQWMLRDKDAHLVSQFLPFFAQTRRLLPSEDKYEKRLWSTAISYMMGVNLRTNTLQDQESEVFRRADALGGMVKDLEAQGKIPQEPQRQRRQSSLSLTDMLANISPRTDMLPTELPEELFPAQEG